MDIVQVQFNFPGIEVNDSVGTEDDMEDQDEYIMDVLCRKYALIITNKYLNMLIACKLGEINSSFKSASASKKRSKKIEKSKKLNIASFSKMLTTKTTETETKKKKSSVSQVNDLVTWF